MATPAAAHAAPEDHERLAMAWGMLPRVGEAATADNRIPEAAPTDNRKSRLETELSTDARSHSPL